MREGFTMVTRDYRDPENLCLHFGEERPAVSRGGLEIAEV